MLLSPSSNLTWALCITALYNEAAYAARGTSGDVKPNHRAIIVKVEVEGIYSELNEQCLDYVRKSREGGPLNRLTASKPRKVWSNHEAILREGADYLSERFRGARETVYQEKCWFIRIASQTNLQFGTFNRIAHRFWYFQIANSQWEIGNSRLCIMLRTVLKSLKNQADQLLAYFVETNFILTRVCSASGQLVSIFISV
jgi:hypothetical protein